MPVSLAPAPLEGLCPFCIPFPMRIELLWLCPAADGVKPVVCPLLFFRFGASKNIYTSQTWDFCEEVGQVLDGSGKSNMILSRFFLGSGSQRQSCSVPCNRDKEPMPPSPCPGPVARGR